MANDGSSMDWRPSKLMLLRLWSAHAGEAGEQLRGKLQLVVSGEAHYFEGGDALVELLLALLRRPEASTSLPTGQASTSLPDQLEGTTTLPGRPGALGSTVAIPSVQALESR
jgi:hypothetical protein